MDPGVPFPSVRCLKRHGFSHAETTFTQIPRWGFQFTALKRKQTEPHRNDANSIVLWRVLSLVYQKICQLFVNLKFIQHYSMPENSAYLPLHI